MTSHVFTRLPRLALAALFLLALAFPLAAQDKGFEGKQYDIGIEGGMWFSGDITFDAGDYGSADVNKNTSLLLRAFADMYVAPKFAVGGYLNYTTGELEYGGVSADASFYEFGIALKPRLLLSPTMALKPGLNIGYRHLERDLLEGESSDTETSADGLGVNLSVELQFLLSGGYIFFVDGGFLSQPAGGNDDADVTWSPIIYLAAGICF